MAYETSSLREQDTSRGLELVMEQRPWVGGWFPLVVVAQILGFVSMMVLDWAFVGMGVFVGGFLLHFAGLAVRRPARFTLTPVELRIEAWTGFPARPQRTCLPLEQIQLHHSVEKVGVQHNKGHALHALVAEAGERCVVKGLACTTEELEAVVALVTSQREQARERVGEGLAEVPDSLRVFLQSEPSAG